MAVWHGRGGDGDGNTRTSMPHIINCLEEPDKKTSSVLPVAPQAAPFQPAPAGSSVTQVTPSTETLKGFIGAS